MTKQWIYTYLLLFSQTASDVSSTTAVRISRLKMAFIYFAMSNLQKNLANKLENFEFFVNGRLTQYECKLGMNGIELMVFDFIRHEEKYVRKT